MTLYEQEIELNLGDNMNKKLKLPHMVWNEIELKKDCFLFTNIKNKSHVYQCNPS